MDRSFLAIATILHRVPRDSDEPRGKPKAGTPRRDEREPELRDGWIRFAL